MVEHSEQLGCPSWPVMAASRGSLLDCAAGVSSMTGSWSRSSSHTGIVSPGTDGRKILVSIVLIVKLLVHAVLLA